MDNIFSKSPESIARDRTAELRRWAVLAGELKSKEAEIRSGVSKRRQDVLKDKKVALFKKLIADAGHQDSNLVSDLAKGFDLTGELPRSGVYFRIVLDLPRCRATVSNF